MLHICGEVNSIMATKGKVSQAQKEAQRRYDKYSTKMVSVKYTPVDINDYYELKEYLAEHPKESANGLIKDLIHNFLQTKDKNQATHGVGVGKRSDVKSDEVWYLKPFEGIKPENIEYLYKHFGRFCGDQVLDAYWIRTENRAKKENAYKFNDWVEHRIKILAENNPKLSTRGKQMELFRLFNVKFPE